MCDGYDPSDGEDGASGLDEFLCEYVDGTMDPVVRAAFEEYLRLNPDLYEHIECLRETRSMLCRYGCRLRAPAALQQRLRERLGEELFSPPPVMPVVADRLSWIAGLSSLVLLIVGFLAANQESGTFSRAEPGVKIISENRTVTAGDVIPATALFDSRASATAFTHMPIISRNSVARAFGLRAPAAHDTFLTVAATLQPTTASATLP